MALEEEVRDLSPWAWSKLVVETADAQLATWREWAEDADLCDEDKRFFEEKMSDLGTAVERIWDAAQGIAKGLGLS